MYKNSIRNKGATHLLRSELNNLKGTLASAAKDVKKNVQKRSAKLQGKVAHEISDQPFKAVGIAMLSGMVLSLIMRKKSYQVRRPSNH